MCLLPGQNLSAAGEKTVLQRGALLDAERISEEMACLIQLCLSLLLSFLQSVLLSVTRILYHFFQLLVFKKDQITEKFTE